MYQIANLRTFSTEDLLNLLCDCAHHLGNAYQDTLDCDQRDTSYSASMACEYLRCQLAVSSPYYRIQ